MEILFNNYVYLIPIALIIVGFYIIIIDKNLIKKIIGLNLVQASVVVFYILVAYIYNSSPAIWNPNNPDEVYTNPTPHVLMLTAIVVGIATTSLACSLIYKIYSNYNSINEEEIEKINKKEEDIN